MLEGEKMTKNGKEKLKSVTGGKSFISMKMSQFFQNNATFVAIRKLGGCTKLQPTTMIQLKAILREINDTATKFSKDREEILQSMAEKDKDGKPKIEDNKYVLTEENKKKSEELQTAFLAQEIKIDRPRIKFSSVTSAELSVDDLFQLEGLIDEEA